MPTHKQKVCDACRIGQASAPHPCPWRESRFDSGACLALPGDQASHVWFIRDGWVAISASSLSGDELSCCVRGPGSMVGLEAASRREFRFEVWTLTPVVACRLPTDALATWAPIPSGPVGALLEGALDELARRHTDLEMLSGGATARVCRFLLDSATREQRHGPLPASERLAFPAKTLARVLGIRPETLSRITTKLRERGALEPGRSIVVKDSDRLREIANEQPLAAQ